jgi:hypothetical protein
MRAMPRYVTTVMLVLGSFLTGCGPMYWQAPGRGVIEFRADSNLCIQEAKSKYEVSERIYRRCMREHVGSASRQTIQPTSSSEAPKTRTTSSRRRPRSASVVRPQTPAATPTAATPGGR